MKEAVLEIIRKASQYNGSVTHDPPERIAGWEDACDSIEESVEKFDPWISIKDRLPPIDCEVFVHCSKGITVWNGSEVIDGVQYMEVTGEFMTDAHGRYGRIIKDVVSWQPLPSPPIEK
jgi:hypothetical protein